MVVLPLTCAQPAWGQGPPTTVVPNDTTVVPAYMFMPVFTGTSRAGVSSVRLGGNFRHTFMKGSDMTLQTTLNASKEEFRLQARSNESKMFQNLLMYRFGVSGWSASVNHMDNRMFNRVVAVTGGFQDVILNTLTLSASLRHNSINADNFRWDGNIMAARTNAEKTFKTDLSQGGEVAGGFGYSLLNRWLVVRARSYYKNIDVTSLSTSGIYPGLFLKEDSTSADVEIHFSDRQVARFELDEFNAREKFTDQERGSLGGQIAGAENLIEETRIVEARVMNVGFTSHMLSGLDLRVDAQHADHLTDYAVTKTRFSHNISDFLRSEVKYTFFTGTRASVNIDATNMLKDLGPQSVSSHNRRSREVKVGLNHAFNQTFNVNATGSALLIQTFYLRYDDNPRDQDQLEHRVNVQITSRPFRKISASIGSSLIRTEFINIDGTLSSSNRIKSRYDFRPSITYNMNERISITQNYGLSIEFTDHTFVPEDNFLDRNVTFSNDVSARITERLRSTFYYGYHFHDRGSYLSAEEGGERYLNREREDRRDQIKIKFSYQFTDKLAVIGNQDYSRREDRTIGSSNVRVSEDGGIEVGIRGNYNFGANRTLRLTLLKANRFGSFTAEAQKDYWIVDAEIKYAF